MGFIPFSWVEAGRGSSQLWCFCRQQPVFDATAALGNRGKNRKYTVNLKRANCDQKGYAFCKTKNNIKDNKVVNIERKF